MPRNGSRLAYYVYVNNHYFSAQYDVMDGIGGGAVKDALSYPYVIATGIFR